MKNEIRCYTNEFILPKEYLEERFGSGCIDAAGAEHLIHSGDGEPRSFERRLDLSKCFFFILPESKLV